MLALPVWCTATLGGLVLFLDLGRIDCNVKSECCDIVGDEVLDEFFVVFNFQREGYVDHFVWVEKSVFAEVPVYGDVLERR